MLDKLSVEGRKFESHLSMRPRNYGFRIGSWEMGCNPQHHRQQGQLGQVGGIVVVEEQGQVGGTVVVVVVVEGGRPGQLVRLVRQIRS